LPPQSSQLQETGTEGSIWTAMISLH